MGEVERNLVISVFDGHQENLPIIFAMRNMKGFQYMLEYCARKGITGVSFYNLAQENKFSYVRVGNYLLKKMTKDKYRKMSWDDFN